MTGGSSVRWGAVVVAAGSGERFGPTNKLLADLNGYPVILWSVSVVCADPRIRECVVVVPKDSGDQYALALAGYGMSPDGWPHGGDTRSESVRAGLRMLSPEINHVAVHDAARPLATRQVLSRVLNATERIGAAIPAIPSTNSIGVRSQSTGNLAGSLNRDQIYELQTPQAAIRTNLSQSLDQFPGETDESAALYRAGWNVGMVPGDVDNLKITYPRDLIVASALAGDRRPI